MDRDELEDLIRRAQGGDLRAFEALLAAHLPLVRRFARAFAPAPAEADDLAQEALVRVHRRLASFRYQSAFSTWVYAVVRSVCLDARRGRAGRARSLERPLEAGHEGRASEAPLPDDELASAEDRQRLWDALARVGEEYRAAVVLYDIEGLSYDEVAAVEGVAVGTVRSRLHRGRAQLRRILEEDAARARPAGTSAGAVSSHLARSGS